LIPDFRSTLQNRISARRTGLIDICSDLLHFALITYALPADRLRPYIPDRFDIPTFPIDRKQLALMSAVPFLDDGFHFKFLPFLRWTFAQTNYRVYVVDRETGEPCVWFFGTTLGGRLVYLARWLWRIPWHYARYELDCQYDPARRAYDHFRLTKTSDWAAAEIDLEDTGEPMGLTPGFSSLDEQILILTHPITGYFHRLRRWLSLSKPAQVGTYSVWHKEIPLTVGRAKRLYFDLYERLGLLSREEMQHPHSVLICPQTTFDVRLPPRRVV